jgi:hypothetical protein
MMTEKNAVFEAVDRAGLDARAFEWRVLESYMEPSQFGANYSEASQLHHCASGYFYTFGQYIDQFSPGPTDRIESASLYEYSDSNKWRNRWSALTTWLERLKEELEAPDLWQEMLKERSLSVSTALLPPTEHFTDADRRYLAESLRRIEADIGQQHQLTATQTQAIHDGFEEIKYAMDRFGKKDWVSMATGLLFNVMVGVALSPSAARDLYHKFAAAVVPLLNIAHKMIQSGFHPSM